MNELMYYFLIFYIYSVLGFIIETTWCFLREKKLMNRGFLIGPYCPIYGICAIILLMINFINNPFLLFLTAIITASILEYITSYIMEKIFNTRWWDYSNRLLNIKGRICLLNSLLFGIISLLLIYVINPNLNIILNKINNSILVILTIICFIFFIIDFTISTIIILKIQKYETLTIKDNTKKIKTEVYKSIKKLLTCINH